MTVLEATARSTAARLGPRTFRMREAGKGSLYRHEVRRAAIEAVIEAVDRRRRGRPAPAVDPAAA